MTLAGIARIRACFENAEEVFPIGDSRGTETCGERYQPSPCNLPQMPQLPQPKAPACNPLTDGEDAYEERAAIIEYDGGLPRPLAEFLARRGREGE